MYKVIAITIGLFISSVLLSQSKQESMNVITSMVNNGVLVGLFTHDFNLVVQACDDDPKLVYEFNKQKGQVLFNLMITGDDYHIQTEVYMPEDKIENTEFSRIYINFTTNYEAKKFLNYFAPVANFIEGAKGKWWRQFGQSAEIHSDYPNVVYFILTYPRLSPPK